jgi:hypothetical protein
VRSIFGSIALAAAEVIGQLATVTGIEVTESPEATSIGNAALQGLALGRLSSLDDARIWIGLGAQRLTL